ncbi:MAG: hypothetical protein AB1445_00570 [Bacillota bacterium]
MARADASQRQHLVQPTGDAGLGRVWWCPDSSHILYSLAYEWDTRWFVLNIKSGQEAPVPPRNAGDQVDDTGLP